MSARFTLIFLVTLTVNLNSQSRKVCLEAIKSIDTLQQLGNMQSIRHYADSNAKCLKRLMLFQWEWNDRLNAYNHIAESYIRNFELEKARLFTRKILFMDPEFLQQNHTSDICHLVPRISSIKLTAGFMGWASFMFPKNNDKNRYNPIGSYKVDEHIIPHVGLISSIVLGIELINNSPKVDFIRSFDFYSEYVFDNIRFTHNNKTYFNQGTNTPEFIHNRIYETQIWKSLVFYPRIRFRLEGFNYKESVTFYALAGFGKHWLESADFFNINQKQSIDGPAVELNPVKLFRKEQMRNYKNTSILAGAGLNYRLSQSFSLHFELRFQKMLENVVSDSSLQFRPLDKDPLYFTDNEMHVQQLILGLGLFVGIGQGL